jgi:acyl-CoA synthetase (AMP-forming)/AMP-acid ligase II
MSSPFAHVWVLSHAESAPDAPCIGTPSGWTSYAELVSRMKTLRAALAARGLKEGDIVMNAMVDGPASIAFTLAAQSLGACVAEMDRSLEAHAVAAIRRETKARKPASPPSRAVTLLPWPNTDSNVCSSTIAKIPRRGSRRSSAARRTRG